MELYQGDLSNYLFNVVRLSLTDMSSRGGGAPQWLFSQSSCLLFGVRFLGVWIMRLNDGADAVLCHLRWVLEFYCFVKSITEMLDC